MSAARIPFYAELAKRLARLHEIRVERYRVQWGDLRPTAGAYDVVLCTRCREVAPVIAVEASDRDERLAKGRMALFAVAHVGHPECLFLDVVTLSEEKPS